MTLVTIERLGHLGDGIAQGRPYPFTLPGEQVLATDPPRIETPSPDRVTAPCRHFPRCGGCSLQHASDPFLTSWKEQVVVEALAARGLSAPIRPIVVSPPRSRRRATFTLRRTKKSAQIGFVERRGTQIVDLADCHVILPAMLDLRPVFEAVLDIGGSRKGALKAQVTGSTAGWDLLVTDGKPLTGQMRVELAGLMAMAPLARLSWEDEIIAMASPPAQRFGRADVIPPPGAFLQATAEGEAALVAAVSEAVGPTRRIADLFAGCGTFTLPLAETAEVHAVEGDAAMLKALDTGWRKASGLHRVSTETRDLFRRPLEPLELAKLDAVVIDPPRAGAEAQTARLAAADVPVIAMVSCNPVTFARDAAALAAAGYGIDWIQVVDQFRWSHHVELAARLSR